MRLLSSFLPFMVGLSLLLSVEGRCAIVNVLAPKIGEQPNGFTLSLGESFSGSGGNVDGFRFKSNLGFRLQNEDHTLYTVGSASVGKSEGVLNSESAFGHFRYRWTFYEPISLVTFVQGSHDRFRRLVLRAVAGAGAEVRLFRLKQIEWFGAIALMPEWEVLNDGVVDDQGYGTRMSSYITQAYSLTGNLTIGNTTFYQPQIMAWGDFRLLNDFLLAYKLNKYFSIRFTVNILYDSKPPPEVEKMDWRVSHGINFSYEHLFVES